MHIRCFCLLTGLVLSQIRSESASLSSGRSSSSAGPGPSSSTSAGPGPAGAGSAAVTQVHQPIFKVPFDEIMLANDRLIAFWDTDPLQNSRQGGKDALLSDLRKELERATLRATEAVSSFVCGAFV